MVILPGDAPPDPRPRLAELGFGDDRLAEVRGALDALNYGNAKYLMLITAWCEAIQGRDSGSRAAPHPRRPRRRPARCPPAYRRGWRR